MKKLFASQEYNSAKYSDLLPLQCYCCKQTFYLSKKIITFCIKENKNGKFCSRKCFQKNRFNHILITCKNCQKEFYRSPGMVKKSKNHFCSQSCSAIYRNLHKTTGNRRSKLEKWLEQKLSELYPDLEILYNDKSAINSELDIYFPSLKLAVEINGIFHYEPIFGESKLHQIQNNDQRKLIACYERNIELLLIDSSSLKYFKSQNVQKYLNIITNILEQKL